MSEAGRSMASVVHGLDAASRVDDLRAVVRHLRAALRACERALRVSESRLRDAGLEGRLASSVSVREAGAGRAATPIRSAQYEQIPLFDPETGEVLCGG